MGFDKVSGDFECDSLTPVYNPSLGLVVKAKSLKNLHCLRLNSENGAILWLSGGANQIRWPPPAGIILGNFFPFGECVDAASVLSHYPPQPCDPRG